MAFVDVLIRQAHPGPGARPYRSFADKAADAPRYRRHTGFAWPVLIDDHAGTTHQVYSTLADPTYLIDADGRIAFVSMWSGGPALRRALAALLARGGRGVVEGGWERRPHLLPAITDGWRGLRLGLWQSVIDLETSMPTAALMIALGHRARPMLAPFTLRTRPLPPVARWTLAGAGALLGLALVARRR